MTIDDIFNLNLAEDRPDMHGDTYLALQACVSRTVQQEDPSEFYEKEEAFSSLARGRYRGQMFITDQIHRHMREQGINITFNHACMISKNQSRMYEAVVRNNMLITVRRK